MKTLTSRTSLIAKLALAAALVAVLGIGSASANDYAGNKLSRNEALKLFQPKGSQGDLKIGDMPVLLFSGR